MFLFLTSSFPFYIRMYERVAYSYWSFIIFLFIPVFPESLCCESDTLHHTLILMSDPEILAASDHLSCTAIILEITFILLAVMIMLRRFIGIFSVVISLLSFEAYTVDITWSFRLKEWFLTGKKVSCFIKNWGKRHPGLHSIPTYISHQRVGPSLPRRDVGWDYHFAENGTKQHVLLIYTSVTSIKQKCLLQVAVAAMRGWTMRSLRMSHLTVLYPC